MPTERRTKTQSTHINNLLKLLNPKDSPFDQRKVALKLVELFGGETGIANIIHAGFKETIPGTLAHVRYLQVIVQFIKGSQSKDEKVELGDLSEEDLKLRLQREVENINGQAKEKPAEPAEPAEQPVCGSGEAEGTGNDSGPA